MKKRVLPTVLALALALTLFAGAAFADGAVYDEQKLDANYALALAYIGREDYDKAMDYLNACLLYCDEDTASDVYADVRLKIACVYTIRQDYEAALEELEEALRVDPSLSEAYLVQTQVYSNLGEYEKAADALQSYIDITGDSSLYEVKAEIYSAVGNVDKALENYKSYIENDSDSPVEAAYKTAVYSMEIGEYEEAINKFEECRKDAAYGPSSYYNMGVCYMRLEKYEKALSYFERVKDKDFDGLFYNTAVCSMLLDRTEDAIEAFTESIEKESFVSDALYNRAICYVSVEEFAKAIVDFTAYLDGLKADKLAELEAEAQKRAEETGEEPEAIDPDTVVAVDIAAYYRGVCELSIGDVEGAIADFTACIENDVAVVDSSFNRGLAYLQNGNYEGSAADLSVCVDNDYSVDTAKFYRSFALAATGENEAAIADLTDCIEHEFNLGQSYYQRAQIYMIMGDEAHYIEDLEASLQY